MLNGNKLYGGLPLELGSFINLEYLDLSTNRFGKAILRNIGSLLKLELSVTREQTNRFTSSKLDHTLSVQKSPSDKTGLGFVESISVFETHPINFVSSSKPSMSEIVKLVEVTHLLGRLGLILKSLSLRILPFL